MFSRVLRTSAATLAFALAAMPSVASAQFPTTPTQVNFDPGSFFYTIATGQGTGFVGNGGTFRTTNNATLLASIDRFFCTDDQNAFADPMNGAWVTALWNNTDMSRTQLYGEMAVGGTVAQKNAASLQRYLENANFANEMRVYSDNNGNDLVGVNLSTDSYMTSRQIKIWNGSKSNWSQQAGAVALTNANARGWFVVTGAGQQELLVYSSAYANANLSTVPEPSTYALMLPAMLGVGYLARRRRSKLVA